MRVDVSSDARFSDIGPLPSACKPYDFKRLMIRPLSVEELKLISQAISLKNIIHLIRAVDLVIDQPVNVLTIGDFFYILMWLRVKSYPKSPVVVSWTCNADYYLEHLEDEIIDIETPENLSDAVRQQALANNTPATVNVDVDEITGKKKLYIDATGGQNSARTQIRKKTRIFKGTPEQIEAKIADKTIELTHCGHQNTEIVRLSNIEILCLPDDFSGLDEGLDFPRVKLLPDVVAYENESEYQYILPAAQWIKEGETLHDKLAFLESQPDLNLFDAAFSASDEIIHGVKETVRLTCAKCSSNFFHTLEINPLTFFRR